MLRKTKTSRRAGLLRLNRSIPRTLLSLQNRADYQGQDKFQNEKINLRTPNNTRPFVKQVEHHNDIFKEYDYSRIKEKICLPLETKKGFVIDDFFVHQLQTLHTWCRKPSSLSSILSNGRTTNGVALDLTFNELLYHVLEGLLPDNMLLARTENEELPNIGKANSIKPYDTCVVDDSPIYAEISERSILTEVTIKGKH